MKRRTLDELPPKVLAFLRGLGLCPSALAAVASAGYTEATHAQGWTLLHKVSGFHPGSPLATTDVKVRDAIIELDRWDEQGLRRIRAALGHHHPDQAAFVFENLEAAQGAEAVLTVARLLERLTTLEQGRSDATRDADKAAIATLTTRGITPQERARLAELVTVAQSAKVPVVAETPADASAANEQSLLELHAWYTDWSETARAVVRRRDHLIRLGLSKRRSKKSEQAEPADAPTTPVAS